MVIFGCTGSSLLGDLSLAVVLESFSLVVSSGGYSLVAMCRFLIVVASLVGEHGF